MARRLLRASGGNVTLPVVRPVLISVAIIAVSQLHAVGATLHVAPAGRDGGDCSSTTPCRTISHGVSVAVAGDTVVVHAGVYRERVRVSPSGTEIAPIVIRADGEVEMDGFVVDGNWVVIDGFRVDHGCLSGAPSSATCRYRGTAGESAGFGFWLTGSDVTIRGNYVTGTQWSGVNSSGARNRIQNNRFIRTGHPGMTVTHHGGYNTVEGNEVADVMSYKYGPDEQWGQDQDGLRIFGTGHVVRGNYIHDIYKRRDGPHVDAVQTFDNWGPEASLVAVLFEANTFLNTGSGGMFQDTNYRLSRDVTWKNNIFVNGDSHMLQVGVKGFRFEGNIFYITRYSGLHAGPGPGHLEGNTFLWVRGTYPQLEGVTGRNNRAYPNPALLADPIRAEPGGQYGVRPPIPNIPLAVCRTAADGGSSHFIVSPDDAAQLAVGATIEIDADGFARTVTAADPASGRVEFTPPISGVMARVPGSTLPADYGNWRIAAAGRAVALWATKNVTPTFLSVRPQAPRNVHIVR